MNRAEASFAGAPFPGGDPPWAGALERFCVLAMDALGFDDWDLSVLAAGDAELRELNREYRGKDEPTDVLSFECGERAAEEGAVPPSRFVAGDIAVSMESMAANAAAFGVPPAEELKRLLVHGILHLAGMDHASNEPGEPMLARQEGLLKELAEAVII